MPASEVANVRPSAEDTDAERASVAMTADRTVISGKVTRCQVRPSTERHTAPPRPTTQQIPAAGDDPAVSSLCAAGIAVLHEAPQSGASCTRSASTFPGLSAAPGPGFRGGGAGG